MTIQNETPVAADTTATLSDQQKLGIIQSLDTYIIGTACNVTRNSRLSGEEADVAQDLRLAAFKALGNWRPGRKTPTEWARQAVLYAIENRSRIVKNAQKHPLVPIIACADEEKPPIPGTIPERDLADNPDQVRAEGLSRDMQEALGALKPGLRAIASALLNGDSIKEVSARFHIERTDFYRRILPALRRWAIESGFHL